MIPLNPVQTNAPCRWQGAFVGNRGPVAQMRICRADARLKGDRSPFNTSSSDLPEILRISGRQICKEAFFTLVDRLPAALKD